MAAVPSGGHKRPPIPQRLLAPSLIYVHHTHIKGVIHLKMLILARPCPDERLCDVFKLWGYTHPQQPELSCWSLLSINIGEEAA